MAHCLGEEMGLLVRKMETRNSCWIFFFEYLGGEGTSH